MQELFETIHLRRLEAFQERSSSLKISGADELKISHEAILDRSNHHIKEIQFSGIVVKIIICICMCMDTYVCTLATVSNCTI